MIPISKEVATKIIIDGIQKGFSSGYITIIKTQNTVFTLENMTILLLK